MKDALHSDSQVLVVAVDGAWVFFSAGGSDLLRGPEQGSDGFLSKHKQGGERT